MTRDERLVFWSAMLAVFAVLGWAVASASGLSVAVFVLVSLAAAAFR